jgi:2-oxoglutarate dehydrogenase E2 component (dihydrolipoamide succinyltransferase)
VAVDEVLFEVSTEKVDTEVPSAHAGYLRVVHVAEGETVPVGAPVAIITETADEELEVAPPPEQAPAVVESAPTAPSRPVDGTTLTRPPSRTRDREVGRDAFLSPVVRSLLAEHDLEPDEVVGTGAGGRITRQDVLATVATRLSPRPAAPAASVAQHPAGPIPEPGPDDEVIEFSKARRATAEHMVRSRATSAHTLVATEVDYHQVDGVRRRAGLSYLPFVARATIDALRAFPHVNASVGHDQLIVHPRINLGLAVDVAQEALVVPVVRDAGDLRLPALAEAMAAVAEKARARRLTSDDLTGGTFTITNVGSYGTVVTAPIINQPQVAILSTDSVRMRPAAVRGDAGEWTVAVRPLGNLSLTFDHRAFDGAYAAGFLAMIRELLETRDWDQEL